MQEEIFRKKSLDKIKSPENLDNYIQVSNPGIWLLLVSIIILLVGACVWGMFGHIDSTVPTTVRVENGTAVCYVKEEYISSVREEMRVNFNDFEASVADIGEKENGEYICTLRLKKNVTDGFYDGKIVIKTVKPLSFILN